MSDTVTGITVAAEGGYIVVRLGRTADWEPYGDNSADIRLTRIETLRLAAALVDAAAPRADVKHDIIALAHTWEMQGRS